jgi:hypothetical protein
VALLYGQLAGTASLRDIITGLQSHAVRLYHLGRGCHGVRRWPMPTPSAVFSELLALMMARAHRGLGHALAETTYLIDATRLRLDARSRDWARFSEGVCGAKPACRLRSRRQLADLCGGQPGRVNDITAAQAMPIEPGATYVFDLGYYDDAWWSKLDAAQCRIVTRLKSNTPLRVVENLPVPADGEILSDRIGHPAPGEEPQQPLCRSGARSWGQDRERQGAAHSVQGPRCFLRRYRRALQAPLGD